MIAFIAAFMLIGGAYGLYLHHYVPAIFMIAFGFICLGGWGGDGGSREHDRIMRVKNALEERYQSEADAMLTTHDHTGTDKARIELDAFNRTVEYVGDHYEYRKGY